MPASGQRFLSRHLPVTIVICAFLAMGAPGALAQGDSSAPNPGTGVQVSPGPGGPRTFEDAATPVVPRPGSVTDPTPTAWDHVTISPDGRTLTVFFWSGAEACYGLDHVELADIEGTLSITLFAGFRADAANVRCREMAQLYSTVIEVATPVLAGGLPDWAGAVLAPSEGELALPGATLLQSEPHPWDVVQVGPDGRSLWVWFTGGVAPCFGLGSVELVEVADIPTLVLQTGPADATATCAAMAVTYRTPVEVPEPILLGGAA